MNIKLEEVIASNKEGIETISVLANTILHEFYGPQMPSNHIDYFLETFQSTEALEKHLKDGWEYYLIQLNGVAIGYLGLEFKDDKMVISKLYVLENQRNTGAGKAALNHAISRGELYSCSVIELFVNTENKRAKKFYERFGFNQIDEVQHTYKSGHTEFDFHMVKTLG